MEKTKLEKAQIAWPNIPREQWEKVNDDTVKTDPLFAECCKVEKNGEDTVVTIKLEAEVHLPPGIIQRNAKTVENFAALLMERYLFDLNVSVLPAVEYHLKKAKIV